jgi:hypothetical protein
MKQRILNKKIKKDCLIQLWLKEWHYSHKIMQNHMMKMTQEDYDNKTSLWYCQFKIGMWMLDYEFEQVIKIGKKKYNVREEQIYNSILPHKNCLTYQQYKRLCK